MPASPLQVCYLPWAGLDREVRVGPVRFVPFEAWILTVPDPATADFWRRYSRRHFDEQGDVVISLAMAVVDGATFGVITPAEQRWIIRAADALIFAHLCAGYGSRALPANRRAGGIPIAKPGRFALWTKSFSPTDTFAVMTSGGLSNGTSLDLLRIQRPPYISSGFCHNPDADLLAGLGRIVKAGPRHPFANQVWQAITWTRLAFAGSEVEVDDRSRVVMMLTTFECCFAKEIEAAAAGRPPRPGSPQQPQKKKKHRSGGELKTVFKHFVDAHLKLDLLRKRRRDFGNGGVHWIPITAEWFHRAFDLRSAIVHGGALRAGMGSYTKHPHILLLILFMWISVRAKLVDAALLPTLRDDPLRLAMPTIWTRKKLLQFEQRSMLRQLYNALGWLKKPRKRRRLLPKP